MKNFGIDRVVRPKWNLPMTAWELDNSKEISDTEMRVRITMLHIEWDSFSQICHSCNFDEASIKAKIMYMVERRGKLHNPYTNSGGVLTGKIEEIGKQAINNKSGLKVGDDIICAASISAIPLKIDSIDYIDYSLGEIYCQGYAILFPSTISVNTKSLGGNQYSMLYFDESSALECANRFAKINKFETVGIMARDIANGYIFAAAVRKNNKHIKRVIVFVDNELKNVYSDLDNPEIVKETFDGFVDDLIVVDLSKPIDAYNYLLEEKGIENLDYIVLSENRDGAEGLAVLLCKENGGMFFSSVKNNYMSAALTAESMGKTINTYSFDTFTAISIGFTVELIRETTDKMVYIKKYQQKAGKDGRFGYITDYIKSNKASEVDGFVYSSKVTKAMLDEVISVSKFDCNVIIEGETGTGKEMVLSLIHENSNRSNKPCVKINCATIQEGLAESEFFGYEGGAFTGALNSGKEGYFTLANNGILFLDEISELSLNMQSKLLRVLQTNQFYKVGGTEQITVDVRVVCASNIPLEEMIATGKFRKDLYYRLNIANINIPPLRARIEDIAVLTEHFLKNYGKKYGVNKTISGDAIEELKDNTWNGNVRELENTVQRLIISSKNDRIEADDVNRILNKSSYDKLKVNFRAKEKDEVIDFRDYMEEQEKKLIVFALEKGKTTRKAAEILNIPQTTLNRKKIKHGLE
ncbi:MAG: sigma-54-dependent Fis family transcriptional regulator [Peptostreptococcaceae bacterium]|nr:sigma-54-dependent Fis family transcriptional regulator [Peptostreptococcaceae bacterium]